MTEFSGTVFGKAALSIFESLILAMLEEDILDEEMVKEILEDAAENFRHGRNGKTAATDEAVVASAIDRFSRTVLTVHQSRNNLSRTVPPLPRIRLTSRDQLSEGGYHMNDNVYSITELVGSSTKSIEDAIEQAVKRASKTIRNLDWFETKEIRGHIKDNKIVHYQVVLKLGFRYDN